MKNKIWKGKIFVRKKAMRIVLSPHPNTTINLNHGMISLPKKGKSILVFDIHIINHDINEPITIRKYAKSFTKNPLSNFISYSNLSSQISTFNSQLFSVEIQKVYMML